MHERSLPASPNWYFSRCIDLNSDGLLGFGAKNVVYLIDVSASSCRAAGELLGHRDPVSGFSFCQHPGQGNLCVSGSSDGSVRFWDAASRVLIREHAAHQAAVAAVHWSPVDSNLVVSGDEKGVVLCHWHHTGDTASFFPEPRTVFCLACSPHSWSTVAVGYKDGMIVLIDVSKKGEVMHRLRGHEDEIHSLAWCPVAGEDDLSGRQEAGEVSSGSAVGDGKGCHLASGSKDQTVRLWSTARGKAAMTLKLPQLKKRGSGGEPGVKERLWLHVHWPNGRAAQLVSSSFSGKLLLWDLSRAGKQKWSLFGTSSESQNHSRIVFNMSSVHAQDGRELLLSTSMDREIKCWDLSSLDCCWTLPTLGGFVYTLTFSPVGTGCLALGVGDNTIRVWNTLTTQNQYDTRTFWQGIRSKITALSWHPRKEGWLSFGTDDGKVGIYDVFSNKLPQISSSYHRKTVYTLAWGPPVPPLSFGAAEGKPACSLYSCAGEGVILQHDPSKLSAEASDIDELIRDTNDIKHKLSPHTDLSWKPDGKVVAVGNEDGCIEVYQAPSLKLLCSVQQHHKIINVLRWHHEHEHVHGLLASGSSNAIVYVHDLRAIVEDPPESPVVLTEPYRRLCGHTAKITGMAWSPHHEARLATVSYDGTAQVWDVLQEAPVSNYQGHSGNLLCVDWSPVDPDVVWTGGKDFTVHEWRISKQEFTKPPKGKKSVKLKEKSKANRKQKKASGGEGQAAAEATAEASDEDERDKNYVFHEPFPVEKMKELMAVVKSREKHAQDLLKKKKPRSLLPVSTSMDHRPKEDMLQDCITLASVTHGKAPPAGCVPGQGAHIHLGLFSDRKALYSMFEAEEEAHMEAGHHDSVTYLRLWGGDLQGALQLAAEKGELNDHLLSIAPMAGFETWRQTVEAFVKQLCLQEQYLKAASHLLSINKLYEAVELLHSHKLHREAIALVKARLPASEPVLAELYTSWASALEKDGHFSAAAKCYLAAGAGFDAVKVIARKNDTPSLRAAAALANISGELDLAKTLALRCAKDLAASLDWVGAQEVLSSQENLLVHRLHLCTAELLAAALAGGEGGPGPSASWHPWAWPDERHLSLQQRVREVWEQHFGVSQRSTGQHGAGSLLNDLTSVECPAPTASAPLRQVQLYSSLHLTRAVLSWLLEDDGELMEELWKVVAWFRDVGHFSISAEICGRLFPDGDVCAPDQAETGGKAAVGSLQAFVSYHRLYQLWWRNAASGSSQDKLVNGNAAEPCGASSPSGPDFDVLFSEQHAHYQATQRSVREVQEKLSTMVLQHSRARGDQPDPAEPDTREMPDSQRSADAGGGCDHQETLLSLSHKMSEYQKELKDAAETLKLYPRPDVMECCLVLLHLTRTSAVVSESLQRRAKDLLGRHATSPSIQKASQRLLT